MEELLLESTPMKEIRRGEIVDGQVVRIDHDGLLVSIGHKSEGMVPPEEMRSLGIDKSLELQVGANIQVYVMEIGGYVGQAVLSLDRARGEAAWGQLEELERSGGTVTGTVVAHNRGGAVVSIDGLQGFVPMSQIALPPGRDPVEALAARTGEQITLSVIEVNRRRNRAVLSERAPLKERREGDRDRLLDTLKEGDVCSGTVSGISTFGAFVDIGGADGLIHISELSWNPVADVEDVVKAGDQVSVVVMRLDLEQRRIALSLKRLHPTPWETASASLSVGALATGVITKLTEFGAFALVENSIEGLIHISELTEQHIRHPREVVDVGDTMILRVVSFDPERRRLGLSLKQVDEAGPTDYHDPIETDRPGIEIDLTVPEE